VKHYYELAELAGDYLDMDTEMNDLSDRTAEDSLNVIEVFEKPYK
jgi:hypothetical protein